MENSHTFTLNADFTTETFEDEILLYALSTGKGIYLNKTAGLVLEMCGNGHSTDEVIALLQETFPEQKDDIRQDVETAVNTLLEHGALLHTDKQDFDTDRWIKLSFFAISTFRSDTTIRLLNPLLIFSVQTWRLSQAPTGALNNP